MKKRHMTVNDSPSISMHSEGKSLEITECPMASLS